MFDLCHLFFLKLGSRSNKYQGIRAILFGLGNKTCKFAYQLSLVLQHLDIFMYCDIFVCHGSMFHKFLYYFKRNQFVFSPELIFFFVAIKVLPRFLNHFHVKVVPSNLSSRT